MNFISQRKSLRDKLLHFSYEWIYQHYPNVPPHLIEFLIKTLHFQNIFVSFFAVFFASWEMFQFNVFVSFILFFFFLFFNGCILSMLEYKFCRDKDHYINIVDPFILFMGKETSNGNRYYYTLYIALMYFFCCLIRVALE